ncbi:MAG: SIR2 family protein [Chloroflexota bacterium]
MPIIKKKNKDGTNPLRQSFVNRIRTGNVVPLISNEVMGDLVFGGYKELVEGYAEYIEYPLQFRDDILRMTRYKGTTDDLDDWDLKEDYLNFLKNHLYYIAEEDGVDEDELEEVAEEVDALTLSEFAQRLGYPKLDSPTDPLLVLASLPLPIYLTTSYHSFLEEALRKAGKEPRSEICRWHPGLGDIESVFDGEYTPSPTEPLVFHLHGLDVRPDSLVLTEDDYLEFLVAIAQGRGEARTDPIPGRVRQALSASAMVLLGFGLPDWGFRVIFWGLIKPTTMTHKGVFSLQLEPSDEEKRYLQQYLKREAEIDIFWGSVNDYAEMLKKAWKG